MANWKKVLVSGSNIEVNNISGSKLNLSGLGGSADDVLIINGEGSISTLAQSSLLSADQTFQIGVQSAALTTPTIFETGDLLLFNTASVHGFSFSLGDSSTTSSITLNTPQDLTTTADVTFNTIQLDNAGVNIKDINNQSRITLNGSTFLVEAGANNRDIVGASISNDNNPNEFVSINFGDASIANQFLFQTTEDSNLISTSGSKVGIGVVGSSIDTTAKLQVAGQLVVDKAITASLLPIVSHAPGLVAFNTSSKGLEFISSSEVSSLIAGNISGAFTSLSASIASDIETNVTNIDTNTTNIGTNTTDIAKGIRFQEGAGTQTDGESVILGNTASFIGTTDEITVTHDGATPGEEKFTFSLPSNVTIANNLTVTDNIFAADISASGDISGSNLNIEGDVTLGGTLSFSGLSFIENQAAVLSGSTIFGSGSNTNEPSVNTHQFTGSVSITGSNGLSIDHGGLNVVGDTTLEGSLAVSGQISGSSHLFASLSLENKNNIVVYDNATGKFFYTASSAIQGQNIIGPPDPTDDSYEDGLLDFNNTTPIGIAVDQINEVLAGLAPPEAPTFSGLGLSNLSKALGNNAEMSYQGGGSFAQNAATGSVTSGDLTTPTSTLSTVNTNGNFHAVSVDGNDGGDNDGTSPAAVDVRIGVIDTRNGLKKIISGTLNDQVGGDVGAFTNYGNDSFSNGDKGVLHIFVNGTLAHSQSLSGSFGGNQFQGGGAPAGTSLNENLTGFVNLSTTQSGHFTGTGNALSVFFHRSGSWQVGPADQREGWNHVLVTHNIDATTNSSNYVEWVNESNEANVSITQQDLTFESGSAFRSLSGVHYISTNTDFEIGYSGSFQFKAENLYRDVHDTGTNQNVNVSSGNTGNKLRQLELSGSKLTTNIDEFSTTTSKNFALLSLNTSTIAASASTFEVTASFQHDTPTNGFASTRPNGSSFVGIDGSTFHPIKGTTNLTEKTLSGILFDSRTDTSTTTKETFTSESFRLPSGSYTDQTTISNAIGTYPSSASLGNSSGGSVSGLLIVPTGTGGSSDSYHTGNGSLIYPTRGLDNYGNITHVPTHAPISQPNYTSLTGVRFYMRAFTNPSIASGGSNQPTGIIKIKGHNSAKIEPLGTLSTQNDLNVALQLPGTTGLLDLATSLPQNGDLTTNGLGCNVSEIQDTLSTSGVNNTFAFSNLDGGGDIAPGSIVLVRISYASNFTRYVSEIEMTNF